MIIQLELSEKIILEIAELAVKIMSEKEGDNPTQEIKTYTVKEVAGLTKRNPRTITNHIKKSLLEAKKTGKNYIITEPNLIKYIENEK